VAVVDGVLAIARQTGHGLNLASRPPDFDLVGVDDDINLHADQSAGNRVGVAAHLNRAAAADLDAADAPPMIELARRQLTKARLLLLELVGSARVPLVDQLREKLLVFFAADEVATAPQEQRLIDDRLQVAVRRLDIAVLMRLADIGPLRLDLVVVHQVTVTPPKLAIFREVVDRRAETVAAMPARRAAQFPKGLLESAAESLERFGKADRRKLPVRVREREVIQQVVEGLAIDRDAQRVHAGEVRRPQPARVMHLGKHDVLMGSV